MKKVKNMLEHQMLILDNVRDSDFLFKKELKKSKQWLGKNELILLKKWLLDKIDGNRQKLVLEALNDL